MVAENDEELSTVEALLLHLFEDQNEGKVKFQSAFFPICPMRILSEHFFTSRETKVLVILLDSL